LSYTHLSDKTNPINGKFRSLYFVTRLQNIVTISPGKDSDAQRKNKIGGPRERFIKVMQEQGAHMKMLIAFLQ